MKKTNYLFFFVFFSGLIFTSTTSAEPFAYITNNSSDTVSVIDTESNTLVGNPIPVGSSPYGVAVNPAGTRVYVTNRNSDNVFVIDTSTNTVIGNPIQVGGCPLGVAINPAGTRVYVAKGESNNVSIIDTATNTVIDNPIQVGNYPLGIAVNPAGTRVYVTHLISNDVYVIDTGSDTLVGDPIPVGSNPYSVAVNPAGTRLYVANWSSNTVSVIDSGNNTLVGDPIPVGYRPYGVAVNPAGTRVYVTNAESSYVSIIDTATNTVIGSPIQVGNYPLGIAVNPAGTRVYVTNATSHTVSIIDTATNDVIANVGVGLNPVSLGQFIGPDVPFIKPTIVPKNTQCDYGTKTCAVKGNFHTGIDYSGNGTAVAVADGTVVSIERMSSNDHGMGNNVILRHNLSDGSTMFSTYSHLASIDSGIMVNETIDKGQTIGVIGCTGYGDQYYWCKNNKGKVVYSPHLHFEMKTAEQGTSEPLSTVTGNPRGVGNQNSTCKKDAKNAGVNKCWGYVGKILPPAEYGYINPNFYLPK